MKKYIWVLILVLLVSCFNAVKLSAQEIINKEEGSFKVVKSKYEVVGKPIRLNDGRILLSDNYSGQNLIFDPKNDTITKTAYTPYSISHNCSRFLLNNGKVLFIGPWASKTSEYFDYQINTSYIRVQSKCYDGDECLVEYIKNNYPKLYELYKLDQKAYEDSMYAQLYNPATGHFERTGKLNIRRHNYGTIVDKDGYIYLYGGKTLIYNDDGSLKWSKEGRNNIEMYNPNTGEFTIVVEDLEKHINSGILEFKVKKGQEEVTISEDLNHSVPWDDEIYTKLKGNKILYVAKKQDNQDKHILAFDKQTEKNWNEHCYANDSSNYKFCKVELHTYNQDTGEDLYVGNIVRPTNLYYPQMMTLPDGRVLIIGGSIYSLKKGSWGTEPVKRGEIFDPYNSVTTFTPKLPFVDFIGEEFNIFMLNDGRILLYSFIKKWDYFSVKVYRKEFLIYTPPGVAKKKVKNKN